MEPPPIIPDFDELEDGRLGLGSCSKATMVNHFSFKCPEKGFGRGVVPFIPFPAHAAGDPGIDERFTVIVACILASSVAVVQQTGYRFALLQSAFKGLQNQVPVQGLLSQPNQGFDARTDPE